MCGIVGIYYFNSDQKASKENLQPMVETLKHRGPDGHGTYTYKNVGLGHTRLSIIDTSDKALQPMSTLDQKLWISYNGEIYNYKELKHQLTQKGYTFRTSSDTEVLLYLYQEYKEKCLDLLQGMFAFAIYDQRDDQLFLARDPVGIKPLYYYKDDEKILFASEIKALLSYPRFPKKINYKAFGHYLQFMNVPVPETIFENTYKLEPAHYLKIHKHSVVKKEYWRINQTPFIDEKEVLHLLEEHLSQAVQSHLIADVPVGAFLSGGVDSSSIVALASQFSPTPLQTFSISFKNVQSYDESRYATLVSEQYKTQHHEFEMTASMIDDLPKIIWHSDEPFAVSSAYAIFLLAQETSKFVKVVLSGDGSDELFAGYPRHFQTQKLSQLTSTMPKKVLKTLNGCVSNLYRFSHLNTNSTYGSSLRNKLEHLCLSKEDFYIQQLSTYKSSDLQSLLTKDFFKNYFSQSPYPKASIAFQSYKQNDLINQKLYTDLKTSLVDEMLTKLDRMTMAHSLEARVPFLDLKLVEFAFRMPGRLKYKDGEGKYALKKAMQPFLSDEILYRKKWGFNVPLKTWFQKELNSFLKDHLFSKKIKESGIFNIKTLTRLVEDHEKNKIDNSNKLFEILVWDLWQRQFTI